MSSDVFIHVWIIMRDFEIKQYATGIARRPFFLCFPSVNTHTATTATTASTTTTVSQLLSTVAHICHGKTYFSTAKLTFPRQNLLFHGKT